MAHGGKRKGSGRKPKADEIRLIETMDAVKAPIEVWEELSVKVEEGDTNAIKTWLSYRYGQPKQSVDHSIIENKTLTVEEAKERLKKLDDEV